MCLNDQSLSLAFCLHHTPREQASTSLFLVGDGNGKRLSCPVRARLNRSGLLPLYGFWWAPTMVATGQDSGSSDAAGGSPARNGQRVAMAGEMGAGTGTGTDAISATPSAAATPASELSESDGGVVGDSKTTVTTEYVRGSGKEAEDRIEKESFTLTHQGAKGARRV